MEDENVKYSKALTWDDLANLYPGIARIKPLDVIFKWARNNPDIFYFDEVEETLHLIIKEDTNAIK